MTESTQATEKQEKTFPLPSFLQIDFSKPVPFRQQFSVMCTVLVISCVLFTGMYVVQLARGAVVTGPSDGEGAVPVQTSAAEGTPPQVSSGETPPQPSAPDVPEAPEVPQGHFGTLTPGALGEPEYVEKYYDEMYDGTLILVNKEYSCRSNGENVELVFEKKSDSYVLSDYTIALDTGVISHLNHWLDAFEEAAGETDLMIACGYRSYETQLGLYNEEVGSTETLEEAEQWVAPPGYSEHQTGLALDLDRNTVGESGIKFDGEEHFSWLLENCSDYGFILRYKEGRRDVTGYAYEPWHFRYVGYPHSEYIQDNDIVLEEYLDILHTHDFSNPAVYTDHGGGRWAIYYTEADPMGMTQLPLPKALDFVISGDNYGGFIVTVPLPDE